MQSMINPTSRQATMTLLLSPRAVICGSVFLLAALLTSPAQVIQGQSAPSGGTCYLVVEFLHGVKQPNGAWNYNYLARSPVRVTTAASLFPEGGCNPPDFNHASEGAWCAAAAKSAGVPFGPDVSRPENEFVGCTTTANVTLDGLLAAFDKGAQFNRMGGSTYPDKPSAIIAYPDGIGPFREKSGTSAPPKPDECERINARLNAAGSRALLAC